MTEYTTLSDALREAAEIYERKAENWIGSHFVVELVTGPVPSRAINGARYLIRDAGNPNNLRMKLTITQREWTMGQLYTLDDIRYENDPPDPYDTDRQA